MMNPPLVLPRRRASELLDTGAILRTNPTAADVEDSAVLAVLGQATDAADARELLEMLGLVRPEDAPAGAEPDAASRVHADIAVRRSTAALGGRTGVLDA